VPGPNRRRCWRVQAEAHYQAHRDDPGYQDPSTYDQPWWDGEPMASDRQRSPELIAELEEEPELGPADVAYPGPTSPGWGAEHQPVLHTRTELGHLCSS